MDESTSRPAFNAAAPRQVVKVKRKAKPQIKRCYKHKPYKGTKPMLQQPPTTNGAPIMTLDVEKYLHQFKDFVMTEEEKVEVLNQLWNIMCRFVELGFGLDSHSITCAKQKNKPRIKDGVLIDLDNPENP